MRTNDVWHLQIFALFLAVGCGRHAPSAETRLPGPGRLVVNLSTDPKCLGPSKAGESDRPRIGVAGGLPTIVRPCVGSQGRSPYLTATSISNGVAMPVAISAANWEVTPRVILFDNSEITVIQTEFDGVDCITNLPLDGSPAKRHCSATLGVMLAWDQVDRVGDDFYFCGPRRVPELRGCESLALVHAKSDGGPWSIVDTFGSGCLCGGVTHDETAIYWSAPQGVRRVDRVEHSAKTILRMAENSSSATPILALKQAIIVSVYRQTQSTLFRVDKNGDSSLDSEAAFLRRDGYSIPRVAANGHALYVLWPDQLLRVSLTDGQKEVLAVPKQGADEVGMMLMGDAVYYFSSSSVNPGSGMDIWMVRK